MYCPGQTGLLLCPIIKPAEVKANYKEKAQYDN